MASSTGVSRGERLRRLFRVEQGETLVARAVVAGLVTDAQVEEARAAAEGRPLTAVLVERGWLTPEALAEIERKLAREDFLSASLIRPVALPPEVEAAAAVPENNFADFVLMERIGRGGAGDVWKAWDRRLGRWVAVKLSTAALASASARERFAREGLATARLAHPNIAPVYQIGSERDCLFLIMPFIDGDTLDSVMLTPYEAVQVVRTVALAVEHAHGQGIVHRDLKPGNIMLARGAVVSGVVSPSGVFVLDFGIAYLREETESRLTRPGEIVGTASFMAPEQARGDRSVPQAAIDIYGLGATLYALVTGRAPFGGESFGVVIARVMNADPEPPTRLQPGLDPRIEAVIAKAMHKDPHERYPSAAALAADLQAILDDRSIDVRAPGPVTRWRARVRRHAALPWALGALVLALLTVAGARYLIAREQKAAVETLRQMARLSLESALRLRRAGDTAGMKQTLPQLIAAHQRVQRAAPEAAASAEVEYLMGRMYRALLDEDLALWHQERALAREPENVFALYERAVLLSRRYGRIMDEFLSLLPEGEIPRSRAAAEAERRRPELGPLRQRIVEDMTRLQALPLGGGRAEAAQGMLAFYRRDLDQARLRLNRAVAADPLMEEAWETLARTEAAAGNVEKAVTVYEQGLKLDRGYVPHLIGLCELETETSSIIARAEAALVLDPDSIGARLCRIAAHERDASYSTFAGGDPRPSIVLAERDIAEVLRRRELPGPYLRRGTLRRRHGRYLELRGEDPRPQYELAEADLTRALALDPGNTEIWAARGRTRQYQAAYRLAIGEDPTRELDAAEADFNQGLKVRSDSPSVLWIWRGDVHAHRGLRALATGRPAEPHLAAALADAERTARLNPDGWMYLLRGRFRTWHGRAIARAGGDPLPDWKLAEADLTKAIAAFPVFSEQWLRRAMLHFERWEYLRSRAPRLAAADRAAALSDLRRALEIDPENVEGQKALARLRGVR